MNEWLAQMYGTNGAEEQEKTASLELFAKLAAQHNIDLSQLSDDQVSELYAETFPDQFAKMASYDDEESKKEAAADYVSEKVAFQEKFAEADLMGRVMAHSFMQERLDLEKIAEGSGSSRPSKREFEARAKEMKAKANAPGPIKGGWTPSQAAPKSPAGAGYSGAKRVSTLGEKAKGFLKSRAGKGTAAALGATALTAAGYGAYKGLKGKDKAASAAHFEELSANQAIKIASAAGFDSDEAVDRVIAVYTLGLEETEKIASVQSVDDAIHVRGLEYLETAGYPVDWSEIFG